MYTTNYHEMTSRLNQEWFDRNEYNSAIPGVVFPFSENLDHDILFLGITVYEFKEVSLNKNNHFIRKKILEYALHVLEKITQELQIQLKSKRRK